MKPRDESASLGPRENSLHTIQVATLLARKRSKQVACFRFASSLMVSFFITFPHNDRTVVLASIVQLLGSVLVVVVALLVLSSASSLAQPEKASVFLMGTTKPKGKKAETTIAMSARPTSTGTTSNHAKRILAAAAEKYSNDATRALKKGSLTPFQSQVYLALCQVPQGHVTTYKNIATQINCKSSQAVGQALRRNPWAPAVPCHRVVSSDLTMGGFFGTTKPGATMDRKINLLRQEGVRFQDNGRIDPECVYRFDD